MERESVACFYLGPTNGCTEAPANAEIGAGVCFVEFAEVMLRVDSMSARGSCGDLTAAAVGLEDTDGGLQFEL